MKFSEEEITQLLAKSYYKAAITNKENFSLFVSMIEELRSLLVQDSLYHAWTKLKITNELSDNTAKIDFLKSLEVDCFTLLTTSTISMLQKEFADDNSRGYKLFIQSYVTALNYKRPDVYLNIFRYDFPFSVQQKEEVKGWEKLNRYIMEGRNVESFSLLEKLTHHTALLPEHICGLKLSLARIQLYYIPDFKQAVVYIDEAAKQIPDSTAVKLMHANYNIKLQKFEFARIILLDILVKDPYNVRAYLGLGNSYFDEGKLEAAEKWYLDGLQINVFFVDLIKKLITLYGSTSLFSVKKNEIHELVQKSAAVHEGRKDSNALYIIYCKAADMFMFQKDYETAETYFQKALASDHSYPYAYIRMGTLNAEKENYQQANQWLEDALLMDEDNYEVLWEYGKLHGSMKNMDKALAVFNKCISLQPIMKTRIYTHIGLLYNAENKYDEAIAWLQKSKDAEPDEKQHYNNLLEVYAAQNNLSAEEELLKEASNKWPDDAGIFNDLAVNLFSQDKFEEALVVALKAVELNDSQDIFYRNLASIYRKLGNKTELIKALKRAYEINPSARNCNNLGVAHFNNEQYEEAIFFYKEALEKDNSNVIMYGNLAIAYERMGDDTNAELIWKESCELEQPAGNMMFHLGNFYAARSRYDEALECYKKLSDEKNENISYLLKIADIYKKKGEWLKALEYYQQIIMLTPEDANIHLMTGELYLEMKDGDRSANIEKAILHTKNAIDIKATGNGYLNLAMAYLKNGDETNSEKYFLLATETEPENKNFRNAVASFYLQQHKPERASEFLDFNKDELTV
ncbi:tetratricopeptide repeat protein [Chitinophaga silvatica]|uniref:Tetratricopeptide repeat protein n=1 Tax=Chitinophaga silvatica TaxID=2282649 RepID=A0A3E1Y4I6_9BACT|nr:tetratricopeptide repeat protein [Chitinophaga silvatica]RFS19591.1 tetratricopeptide repeat protein [Chitinophaga silvatica]